MRKIASLVIIVLVIFQIAVAQKPEQPKLFIGIVVDQMREDFLFRFYDQYGEGGFKRLVDEGAVCRNVHYNYTPTITAVGHTSVYAGTTPKYHGIIGNSWYNRQTGKVEYCVEDSTEKVVGNPISTQGVSPRKMLSTNLPDELKISTNKKATIYSISTKDRAATLSAGHMADGAFWLDLSTGNYVSSTFFMNKLPDWLVKFNSEKRAFQYLEQTWDMLLPIESYPRSIDDDNRYEEILKGKERPTFPYKLKELAPLNDPYFEVLNRSPFGNSLLCDLAIEMLKNKVVGHGTYTDMLAISFSSTDAVGHTFGPLSKETNDTYLRLDRDLARLLNALDQYVGKGNYALFLTADHGVGEVPNYLLDNNVPAGDLNEQALWDGALQFMNSKLGEGNWFTAIRNDQFYLNRELIDQKKLNLTDVQELLASYVNQQEGIAETFTATQLMQQEYTEYFASKVQNGFNYNLSGDVKYIMQPGWYADLHTCATHNSCYNYDSHVPLIFYGTGFVKGVSYEFHPITDIAPTISTLLKIKFPSAATGQPIKEVLK